MTRHNYSDVLVVGAGLTGLRAAVTVHQAGLSCLILEANERIGGKVLSKPNAPDSDVTVDLGPAWINDTNQSHMYALGQRYGAKFEKQFIDGDHMVEIEDGRVIRLAEDALVGNPNEQQRILELIGKVDAIGEQIERENYCGLLSRELDQLTFKAWIEKETDDLQIAFLLANFLTRALVGAEAAEISALFMLKYIRAATGFANISGSGKDGGQYLRPYQGSQIFVNGLASELPSNSILTGTPVTSITQDEEKCIVTSAAGQIFTASKVIVAIPTPLYKHITFDPPLPPTKTKVVTSTRLGYYTKVIVTYSSPWWRAANLTGEVQSFTDTGPISLILDTSIPAQSQFSLSLFILSRSGRTWSRLSTAAEREKAALDHLDRLFSSIVPAAERDGITTTTTIVVPEPLNVLTMDWSQEPWIEGAPSSLYGVGVLNSDTSGQALREPVGHVHFAGTEMSEVWEGYMEGAVRDGERGAKEVVAALSSSFSF